MTGVSVRVGRLAAGVRGLYDHRHLTVWLSEQLTAVERRCTLTHELIHAERADTALSDPVLNARQERQVHAEASRRLVSVDQLAEALAWTIEATELAECLEVDLPTLQARLDVLTAMELAHLESLTADRGP